MANRRFPGRLFDDWPAKVLSLSAAIFVFFAYNLTRLEQRTISVPLSVTMGEEVVPASAFPRTVKVSLKGERDTISALREDDVAASLDLSNFKTEGAFRVPVRLERRGLAVAADPLEIAAEPGEVVVAMEKKTSRLVPVTPSFRGFLEPGFELVSFELTPSEAEVAGPAGAVARATEIATESIELSGRKSDFSLEVRLLRKDGVLSFTEADTVRIKARVRRSLESRLLENVRITPKGLQPGLSLADSLPAGTVRLHSATEPASLQAEAALVSLAVNLSGFSRPGIYTVKVEAIVPPGSFVETFEPQTVTVRLLPSVEGQ